MAEDAGEMDALRVEVRRLSMEVARLAARVRVLEAHGASAASRDTAQAHGEPGFPDELAAEGARRASVGPDAGTDGDLTPGAAGLGARGSSAAGLRAAGLGATDSRAAGSGAATPDGVAAAKAGGRSWESLIGGQVALWIGSAAVFLALAFGLAYAWESIPPLTRVGGGFALALVFLAGSVFVRGRAEGWFADGLAGAGLALAYLDAWAGFAHHQLYGTEVEFALMLLTTGVGAALAVRHDAMVIGLLATLGGFMTPYVASGPEGIPWPLFGYVAVLDGFVLGVSFYKRWPALGWVGLVGTVLLAGGTAWHPNALPDGTYPADYAIPMATFFTLYGVEFALAAVGYGLRRREESRPHDVLLLVATGALYGAATFEMLEGTLGGYRGAFPLALALGSAILALVIRRVAPQNRALRAAAVGLAILFLTVTPAVQFDTSWLTLTWVVEGALLEALGARLASGLLLRSGWVVSLMGLVLSISLIAAPDTANWPFFNAKAVPMLASVLASLFQLGWARRPDSADSWVHAAWVAVGGAWLVETQLTAGQYPAIAASSIAALNGALLALAAIATHHLAARWGGKPQRGAALGLVSLGLLLVLGAPLDHPSVDGVWLALVASALALVALVWLGHVNAGPATDGRLRRGTAALAAILGVYVCTRAAWGFADLRAYGLAEATPAALTVTAIWLAWGVLLLGLGLRLGRQELRRIALGLLALTAFKVLVIDLATLPTLSRILASGALGVVLIGTSWLYSRIGRSPAGRSAASPPAPESEERAPV